MHTSFFTLGPSVVPIRKLQIKNCCRCWNRIARYIVRLKEERVSSCVDTGSFRDGTRQGFVGRIPAVSRKCVERKHRRAGSCCVTCARVSRGQVFTHTHTHTHKLPLRSYNIPRVWIPTLVTRIIFLYTNPGLQYIRMSACVRGKTWFSSRGEWTRGANAGPSCRKRPGVIMDASGQWVNRWRSPGHAGTWTLYSSARDPPVDSFKCPFTRLRVVL